MMGWNTGADVLRDIIEVLNKISPKIDRDLIYIELIPIFENYDCDVLDEIEDATFQEALRDYGWYEEK